MEAEENKTTQESVDKRLIDMLVCTGCGSEVQESKDGVKCTKCGKEFKLREGILIME